MPVTRPVTLARNLTPSSTWFESASDATAGVAALLQRLTGVWAGVLVGVFVGVLVGVKVGVGVLVGVFVGVAVGCGLTVTVKLPVAWLPAASVAVQLTVVV